MRTLIIEDLFNIQNILKENGYGDIPLKITVEVLTEEKLKKINEELSSYSQVNTPFNDKVDQINVNIENIEFQYKLKK